MATGRWRLLRRRRLARRSAAATTALACALVLLWSAAATANPVGGWGTWRIGNVRQKGFDTCAAPSASRMQTWWSSSPYWDIGIYLGGSNRGCSQPNLTTQWLEQVHAQGWNFYVIWVGPQAPCTGYGSRMSWDPNTSFAQGRAEADAAIHAAWAIGFTGYTMFYFDMEGYDTGSGACRSAVASFVNGWVSQLRGTWYTRAGVYGSSCGSAVSDWGTIPNPPDTVWLANWNHDPDVWGISCVPDGWWVGDGQRLHQYVGGHTETWGGVSISIDNDCAYAFATPDGRSWADSACTVE